MKNIAINRIPNMAQIKYHDISEFYKRRSFIEMNAASFNMFFTIQ